MLFSFSFVFRIRHLAHQVPHARWSLATSEVAFDGEGHLTAKWRPHNHRGKIPSMVRVHLTAVRWPRAACKRGRRGEGRVGVEDPLSALTLYGGGTPPPIINLTHPTFLSDHIALSPRGERSVAMGGRRGSSEVGIFNMTSNVGKREP